MRHDGQWCTAIGVLADSCGITQWQHNTVHRAISPGGREHIRIDRQLESKIETAAAYSSVQPWVIPVRWEHRNDIGQVVLLDRRQNRLQAVAVLPHPAEMFGAVELFFSSGTSGDDKEGDDRLVLHELSLTPCPAVNGLPPVQFYSGLPSEAKGRQGAPWGPLSSADEVIRAARGGIKNVECRFDDFDRPQRPAFDSRAARDVTHRPIGESSGRQVLVNGEWCELLYRPATITAVNGRPVGQK